MPKSSSVSRSRRQSAGRATFPAAAVASVAAAALSGVAPAGAAPANPNTYEQVTRASGAQGWSPYTHDSQPVAVSDSGRYAVFSSTDYPTAYTDHPVYVRDIVANTTTELVNTLGVENFDRSERFFVTRESDEDGGGSIWVRRTDGGPGRKITDLGAGSWGVTSAISGDGKIVAVANENTGITLYNATTSAKLREIPGEGLVLNSQSLSDDASVIAGTRSYSSGFYVQGSGPIVERTKPTLVSGNGNIVVALGEGADGHRQIDAKRLSDGLERSYPEPTGDGHIVWFSADGSRLATAGDTSWSGTPAQQLNLATGAWSSFGGPFGTSLRGDLTDQESGPSAAVSRNGKYAVLQYGGVFSHQLALVSLQGTDLPGTQEPLSTSSYLQVSPPLSFGCDTTPTGKMLTLLQRPAPWAPLPKTATLKITVDGATAVNANLTKPLDPLVPGSFPTFTEAPFAVAAKSIVIKGTVVDAQNRSLTTTETTKPTCLGGFIG